MTVNAVTRTVGVVVLALAAGCAAGSKTSAPAPTHSHAVPTMSTSPPAPGTTTSATATLPDGSRMLFPGHRIVAYYGAAGAPRLGVLGSGGPEHLWPRLIRQAREYAGHGKVIPAYELIAYVATNGGHNAAQRVSDETIRRYAQTVRRHHGLLILDIQPGRGHFLRDAKSLHRWLVRPDVGLALDPEWKLHGDQQPLAQIGHTDASVVNDVSAWLDQLTAAHQLPQKLLLVHQFTAAMVRNKHSVRRRSHLAITFNMDGFGSRTAKLSKYRILARDRRFPVGLKLFYRHDSNLFSPRDVLRLHRVPEVVDYE